jgi:hypothetical protein
VDTAAEQVSTGSFYGDAIVTEHSTLMDDLPIQPPDGSKPKTEDEIKKYNTLVSKYHNEVSEFPQSRLVTEKCLALTYARTALINIRKSASDQTQFQSNDSAWFLRAVELSLPEGLETMRAFFCGEYSC